MPWDTGVYKRTTPTYSGPTCWFLEKENGFDIESTRHDTHDQDLADGITACLNKNGENAMAANLAMGGYKVTGLADGTAPTDGVTKQQLDVLLPTAVAGNLAQYNGSAWAVSPNFEGYATSAWMGVTSSAGISVYDLSGNVVLTASAPDDVGTTLPLVIGGSTITLTPTSNGDINLDGWLKVEDGDRVRIGTNAAIGATLATRPTSITDDAVRIQRSNGDDVLRVLANNGETYMQGVYDNTIGSSPNVHITSNGFLRQGNTSSLRYKDNIEDYTYGLQVVNAMRPVSFTGKNDTQRYAGYIAEEIDALGLSELVVYDDEGRPDALNYDRFTTVLVNAVKELTARVQELEAQQEG